MKKITKDCYVNVENWTKGEVQKAAKMFAEVFKCHIGNIDVHTDYKYLLYRDDGHIFVDKNLSGASTQLTKEDIFGSSNEEASEWDVNNVPLIGEHVEYSGNEWEVCGVNDGEIWLRSLDQFKMNVVFKIGCIIFKPIKSEKDKEIEKISDQIYHGMVNKVSSKSMAEHLYDQGLRFVDE